MPVLGSCCLSTRIVTLDPTVPPNAFPSRPMPYLADGLMPCGKRGRGFLIGNKHAIVPREMPCTIVFLLVLDFSVNRGNGSRDCYIRRRVASYSGGRASRAVIPACLRLGNSVKLFVKTSRGGPIEEP